jgi:MoxR-like ATPase
LQFRPADEINRACQSAISLTEAMQEKQVTIGDTTFKLDHFLVLATKTQ